MIRAYTSGDEDEVIRIWLEASLFSHDFIAPEYWRGKEAEMRNIYLPDSKTFVNVDHSTQRVTGFLSLINNYIAALFVSPVCQGRGVGDGLLTYAMHMYSVLELSVFSENRRAVLFYQKRGFSISGESLDAETGQPEFRMTRVSRL